MQAIATPTVPSVESDRRELPQRTLTGSWDLWSTCLLGLGLTLNNWLAPNFPTVLSVVLGLLLGFVLPGYALVSVLFVRSDDLDEVERWGLSLVLSIVMVIVAALLLSEAHIRLSAASVTITLSGATLVLAVAAAIRREMQLPGQAYRPRVPSGRWPYITLVVAMSLGISTWLIVGANTRAVAPEFVITNSSGQFSGYPFKVRIGRPHLLTLRLNNPTDQRLSYRLVESDARSRMLDERQVRVAPHHEWIESIVLPANAPTRREFVRFTLYRGEHPLRQLWIRYWIMR
ncbi:MAG: DUF1616 domain-containing protein [Chloroflexota bacterium]